MGTKIEDIIVVNITRETAKITRVGFGTGLIFGIHTNFAEDYREYGSIEAVGEDFLTTDEEYKAAAKYFGQELKPEKVIIGKRATNVAQSEVVTVANVQNNVTYTTTINGTPFNFLSDADATNLEIAAGLVSAINLGSEPVTATDNVDGTFDLDADVAGEPFTVAVSDDGVGNGLTVAPAVTNVNVATELNDLIQAGGTDWYFLILTRRATEAEQLQDIEQAADFIEALSAPKLYFTAIDQASLLTSATTDIASVLKAKTYDRTVVLYSADQANYPDAAWVGDGAPHDAGSRTWKFKTLVGITPDQLSDTEISNLGSKNANYYETIANANVISSEAVVVGGEYIDVIRGSDELQVRIGEDIFTQLINTEKIPFTTNGIAAIESTLRARLQRSVNSGFLSDDPDAITVIVPKISDIAPADKAARFLQGLEFSAVLAGAVHKVQIDGKLTL